MSTAGDAPLRISSATSLPAFTRPLSFLVPLLLPRAEGLLVARMSRTSSAYLSGLRPGDVVLTFNGTKVDSATQLWRLVADTPIGTSVKLKVRRGERRGGPHGAGRDGQPAPAGEPVTPPLAFSFFDGQPEWSEVALVLGLAFVVASLARPGRRARWCAWCSTGDLRRRRARAAAGGQARPGHPPDHLRARLSGHGAADAGRHRHSGSTSASIRSPWLRWLVASGAAHRDHRHHRLADHPHRRQRHQPARSGDGARDGARGQSTA